MSLKIFFIILLLSIVDISFCIVCKPGLCASVQCEKIEKCEAPNQVVKPGGFCNCCNLCHTILSENESCNSIANIFVGAPPQLVECGEGLICHEGKCKSFKNLGKVTL